MPQSPAESADHRSSDLPDLGSVSLHNLRTVALPAPAERLLDEVRRPRANALGGSNPGRAE
ncbi:aldo/keto reductase [Streptomyces sp. NBC_00582]|uniref:aldo/keto reductase n=1 Tax=Streptomyces sp. NBC_00582 TaxID=2975783 RepID=UPI001063B181|nr:aldo/keto reductase [Streptomyces sp. NBC_00582]WUB60342.1 aldo/keto reductase [Streptomyces sp. NBC_00582]